MPFDKDAWESYRRLSEQWEDPETATYDDLGALAQNKWNAIHNPEAPLVRAGDLVRPEYKDEVLGKIKQNRLECVDGPFDGSELDVPPGGQEVIINAAFGKKTGLTGPVIYRVTEIDGGNKRVLLFVGQPDQTDEEHTDEPDEGPTLILPDDVVRQEQD